MKSFIKIRPLGAELVRRTDMRNLIVVFISFANASKNSDYIYLFISLFIYFMYIK
jgi:hypothetical protein